MNSVARRRIQKAHNRFLTLKRNVRWWSASSRAEKLSVLAVVRDEWRDLSAVGAAECNNYDSAADYLAAQEFYRRRAG